MKLPDFLEIWLRLKLDRVLAWVELRAEEMRKWGAQ